MITVDWLYYQNTYKGTLLSQEEFERNEPDAELYLMSRTFGNVANLDDNYQYATAVKRTLCSLTELLATERNDNGTFKGTVTSESVGGWSKSYLVDKDSSTNTEGLIYKRIESLLGFTGLLYGGVCSE